MASDAVTLIKNDHRVLEGLFAQLQGGKGDRRELLEEVAARLTAHSHAEEKHVYSAITKADPDERDEIDHAYHEHHEAEHLLEKVREQIDSPDFEQALTEFVDAVQHHVQEEESEVLPALQKAVDKATLTKLGADFERTRLDELTKAGFGDGSDDLAGATKQELYEKAKDADISGRSTMTKDELADALGDNA